MSLLHIAWIIPILPFTTCALLIFFGDSLRRRIGEAVGWIGVAGIAATIPLSVGALLELLSGAEPVDKLVHWAAIGNHYVAVGYAVDPLGAVMLSMVSVVATCIVIYSIGYMHGDDGYQRFFAYMMLFCGSMLLLVIANTLLVLYVAWELVGLCSYLLIGFWFERKSAADAAKKAFITTRIGDVGFAIGILIIFAYVPSLYFGEVSAAIAKGAIPLAVAAVAAVLLFCGAIGKSAQFPLHTWLPDAMEGPTPVSALIHAATMVAAGVYMVARLYTIFYVPSVHEISALWGLTPLLVVAFIGLITALLGAILGVVQHDIKRVLAYSTISQLGYMMCALGMGTIGFVAGVFHLINHAFFKSLLFLGSGSVIHGCDNEQNMWRMGGLGKRMPITAITFWCGTLALAGIPLFSGFFSKDEIMAAAWHNAAGESAYWVFFIGLELAAFLTAFYMGRCCYLTFSGEPRSEVAATAHESPPVMTIPLMVLAFFAVFLGWVGTPLVGSNLFEHFVHYTGPALVSAGHITVAAEGAASAEGGTWIVALISIAMALGGLLLSAAIYKWRVLPVDVIKKPLYPLYLAAKGKFYFDELYAYTVVAGTLGLSQLCRLWDVYVIDGLVNAVGWGVRVIIAQLSRLLDLGVVDGMVNLIGYATGVLGEVGARLQTGKVQEYLAGIGLFAGAIAIAVFLTTDIARPLVDWVVQVVTQLR